MAEQAKKQGAFEISLPKGGEDSNGYWTIYVRDMDEATFVAASSIIRKEKDLDAIRFILRTLEVKENGKGIADDVNAICADWKAILASAEQVLGLMPQGRGKIKKN